MAAFLTVWFALGGVDGVRVGLNRAYGMHETRSTFALYTLQVLVVVLGALASFCSATCSCSRREPDHGSTA